jgi:acyl-CoA reductase-like NAD-dependent aldehyde dehydrogenase
MTERLDVTKTYKLFIGGAFPRSESGRSIAITGRGGEVLAHISHASRKDLRDAVEAARKAQLGWAGATAYNRGQVLYRMAEMLEGKRDALTALLDLPGPARRGKSAKRNGPKAGSAGKEVAAAIDRLVCFGGWADKYAQVLGCNNPVAGPYYNFTVPEPTGVVGVVAPDEPALLGLISLIAPPLCAGNTIVALASESSPLVGAVLGEVCATSDVPAGVINILTGKRDELVPHFASHRDIDALHAAGLTPGQAKTLREGCADNLKRVTVRSDVAWHDDACHNPWWIEPFVEMKTVWHPSGA